MPWQIIRLLSDRSNPERDIYLQLRLAEKLNRDAREANIKGSRYRFPLDAFRIMEKVNVLFYPKFLVGFLRDMPFNPAVWNMNMFGELLNLEVQLPRSKEHPIDLELTIGICPNEIARKQERMGKTVQYRLMRDIPEEIPDRADWWKGSLASDFRLEDVERNIARSFLVKLCQMMDTKLPAWPESFAGLSGADEYKTTLPMAECLKKDGFPFKGSELHSFDHPRFGYYADFPEKKCREFTPIRPTGYELIDFPEAPSNDPLDVVLSTTLTPGEWGLVELPPDDLYDED